MNDFEKTKQKIAREAIVADNVVADAVPRTGAGGIRVAGEAQVEGERRRGPASKHEREGDTGHLGGGYCTFF